MARFQQRDSGVKYKTGSADSPSSYETPQRFTANESAHERIEEREQQLQTVLDTTPDCIKLLDRDGRITQMNRSGTELLGCDPAEVIGHSVYDFINPNAHGVFRGCLGAVFRGESVNCEFEIITRSKTRRLVESRMVALRDMDSDITAALAITRDVTEERRADAALADSERHFRNLVENLSDVVLLVDGQATILYINQMSEAVLGYHPAEVIGRAGWLFVHPEDVALLRSSLKERLAGHESPTYTEVRMRHRDGSWRVVQLRARRYQSGSHADESVLVTARDVTEARKTEDELQNTREQLLQAQKLDAIGRLAGGIAHDFNNLLTAIGGHADLLIEAVPVDHPTHHDLVDIRTAVDRAATLTRQLLAFSRKQVLQTTVIDVRELVTDTRSMLSRLISEDIEIVTALPAAPALVRADYTQLQQVLVNLAVNARDALPRGGRIEIEVALDEHDGAGCVHLCVTDDGTGMSADTLSHIFEPFFTTKDAGKGTGLGLPTVYGIVQQSGGRIDVSSEPGSGSSFEVHLPAVEGEDTPRKTAGMKANLGERGRETILLVEDEGSVREVTARMLRRGGYDVLEAGHADEAVDVAQRNIDRIIMVVSDVGLPGRTGPELVELLLDMAPDLKVLFMSGYANDAIFAEGRIATRHAFLEKPFTAHSLLDCVRSVLDN